VNSRTANRIAAGVFALRRGGLALGRLGTRVGLRPLPALLTLGLGAFLIGLTAYGMQLFGLLEREWYGNAPFQQVLREAGAVPVLWGVLGVIVLGALWCLAAMSFGRRLSGTTLSLVRKAYITGYAMLFAVVYGVYHVTGLVVAGEVAVEGVKADNIMVFYWRWELCWPAGVLFCWLAALHLLSWRRVAINLYHGLTETAPARGDLVLENARSHGSDPAYRRSLIVAVSAHLAIIIVIPWLMTFGGCMEPYRVPKGDGDPVVNLVRVVKPPKKKVQKYVLRPDSAIFFSIPDLADSKIEQEVKQESEVRHVADPNSVHGKTGKGGKGGPGWPDGMDNAVVRFIRLQYRGGDWDDGMDARTRADMNFLEAFRERTKFKIAGHSEAYPISKLQQFPKGFAPPFVYMTGSGAINLSADEMRGLRAYLLDGGMLFADAGSAAWDRSFRAMMQAMMPDKPLVVIADDDPLYQYPYVFAEGAPPLWHHGGSDALGVKHLDRWVVFYHPGDINDAWKTGHSGMSKPLAEASFDLGTNIIYYAFTQYLEATRKYRK
jgi:hypothetical protein